MDMSEAQGETPSPPSAELRTRIALGRRHISSTLKGTPPLDKEGPLKGERRGKRTKKEVEIAAGERMEQVGMKKILLKSHHAPY